MSTRDGKRAYQQPGRGYDRACRIHSLTEEHFDFSQAVPDSPVTVRDTTYKPEHLTPLSVRFRNGDKESDTGTTVYLRDRCGDILRYDRDLTVEPRRISTYLLFGGAAFILLSTILAGGLATFLGASSTMVNWAMAMGFLLGAATPPITAAILGRDRLIQYGLSESTDVGYYTGRPPTFKRYDRPGVLLAKLNKADRISGAGQRFLERYGNDQRTVVVDGTAYTISALPTGDYLIKPDDEIVPRLKSERQLQSWLEQHNEQHTTGLPTNERPGGKAL